MTQKISIIIAVFNGENYLVDAIDSVLAQDYPNKEIIVIDDGSTDKTALIANGFGARIRYSYQANQGLGAARNRGVTLAVGDYLAFLDHDDLWSADKLSQQMHAMTAEDPLVFGHTQQFFCPSLSAPEKSKVRLNQAKMPGFIAGTLLISKQRFLRIGFFSEKKQVGEFIDWYFSVLASKAPMVLLDKVLLYRRVHLTNMGRQQTLYSRLDYLKVLKTGLDRRRAIASEDKSHES